MHVARQSTAYGIALLACLGAGLCAAMRAAGPGLHPAWQILALVGVSVGAALLVAFSASRLGHRRPIPGALEAGLVFALTLPAETAVVPAGIAMAFGLFVGREVFGAADRSFVHPAVLAHVGLALTWPGAMGSTSLWLPPEGQSVPWVELFLLRPAGGAIGASSTIVCCLGGLLLLGLRRISWRTLASVPIGMAAGLGLLGRADVVGPAFALPQHLMLGSVALGVVFLATDPNSSPSSHSGRWFHGVLVGFLIILFRVTHSATPDGTLPALLVASIFSPLLDHAAAAGRRNWSRFSHA